MNAPTDLSMKTNEVLRVELAVFRNEHRDLDDAIRALVDRGTADQLTLQRLKKKKLKLKDCIARIEDRLTPDIIAYSWGYSCSAACLTAPPPTDFSIAPTRARHPSSSIAPAREGSLWASRAGQ